MADADLLAGATQERWSSRPAPPSRQPRSVLFLAGSLIGANAREPGPALGQRLAATLPGQGPASAGDVQALRHRSGLRAFFPGRGFPRPEPRVALLRGQRGIAAASKNWRRRRRPGPWPSARSRPWCSSPWRDGICSGDSCGWPPAGRPTPPAPSPSSTTPTTCRPPSAPAMILPASPWLTSSKSTLTVALLVLVYLWSFYGLCLRLMIADLVAMAPALLLAAGARRPQARLRLFEAPADHRRADLRRGAALRLLGDHAGQSIRRELLWKEGAGRLLPGHAGLPKLRIPAPGHHAGDLSADGRTIRPHRQTQGPHSHDRQTHAGDSRR